MHSAEYIQTPHSTSERQVSMYRRYICPACPSFHRSSQYLGVKYFREKQPQVLYCKYFGCLNCGYCLYLGLCTPHTPNTRSIWAFSTAHTTSTPSVYVGRQYCKTLSTREHEIYSIRREYKAYWEHLRKLSFSTSIISA